MCGLVNCFYFSFELEVTIFNINCQLRRGNICREQNFLFFSHSVEF